MPNKKLNQNRFKNKMKVFFGTYRNDLTFINNGDYIGLISR